MEKNKVFEQILKLINGNWDKAIITVANDKFIGFSATKIQSFTDFLLLILALCRHIATVTQTPPKKVVTDLYNGLRLVLSEYDMFKFYVEIKSNLKTLKDERGVDID